MDMILHTADFEVKLAAGMDMADITQRLESVVRQSAIRTGQLWAVINGSTGSLTAIEYEPGVIEDLRGAINRMAPPDMEYAHEKAWHDGNGHSHVQAAMIGPSISMPIRNSSLKRGTWQQIVAINHDNRPRSRSVTVTAMGEG